MRSALQDIRHRAPELARRLALAAGEQARSAGARLQSVWQRPEWPRLQRPQFERLRQFRFERPQFDPNSRAEWGALGGYALRSLGLASLALVIALGLFVVVLQTPIGLAAFARSLEQYLSTDGRTLSIGTVEGSVPGDVTLHDVGLADARGVYLTADRLRVEWSPFSLLTGRLDIRLIEAGTVAVLREPSLLGAAAAAIFGDRRPGLPASLWVGRLAVATLQLPTGVGPPARLAVEALLAANDPAGAFDVRFAARRSDSTAGTMALTFRYTPATRGIALHLKAQEAAPGVLAGLLGLPNAPSIAIDADGEGSVDGFRATLALTAGERSRAEIVGQFDRSGSRRNFRFTATGDLGAAVAADRVPLFDGRAEISASGRVDAGGVVELERVEAKSAAGQAALVGGVGPDEIDLRFDVIAGQASRYAGLLPVAAGWEQLRAYGRVGGSPQRPSLSLSLEAAKLAVAGNAAEKLAATARLDSTHVPAGEALRFEATSQGTAEGLSSSDPRFARLATGNAAWRTAATIDPARGEANFRELAVDLPSGRVRYQGTAGSNRLAGVLDLEAVDLSALSGLAGRNLAGRADLAANIDAALDGASLSLGLKASATGLSTDLPPLDRLLGGQASVEGGLWWRNDGSFGFEKFSARSVNAVLGADGRAERQAPAGVQARVDIADLGRLDPALAGPLRMAVRFGGRLDALSLQSRVEIDRGAVFGRPLDAIVFTASLDDLQGMGTGTADLAGRVGGQSLAVGAKLARAEGRRLRLGPLEASLGPARLAGALTVGLTEGPRGTLDLTCPALAQLASLLPAPVAGALEAKLDFAGSTRGTTLRFAGRSDGLAVRGVSARTIGFDGEVRGLFDNRVLRAKAEGEAVAALGARVERLRVNAEQRGTALLLALDGAGHGVEASGRLRFVSLPEELRIGMETMLITARGEKITLPTPTFLKVTQSGFVVENLVLRAGTGEITIIGRAGADLDLKLAAKSVPLAWAELALPGVELAGAVSATADIGGRATDPRGRYEIAAEAIGVEGAEHVSGRIGGDIGGGRALVRGTLAGGATRLAFDGSVPVTGGPIELSVSGRADLATIVAAFAGGARLNGQANIDAKLGGSFAAPELSGTAESASAAYRSPVLELTDAAVSLKGAGDRVQLSRFEAKLAGGGKVSAYGSVGLRPGYPSALKIDLDGARFGHTDLVTALGDAALTLDGPLAARPRLQGLVTLRGVDMKIPELPTDRVAAPALFALPLPVDLQVRVVAPNRVQLRGRGVEAEFGGEIAVTAGAEGPLVGGDLALRRGTIGLADVRVPLTGGRARFTGSLDPRIALAVSLQDARGTVEMAIEGALSDPSVRLAADPSAADVDIVTRLLRTGLPGGKLDPAAAVSRALDDLAARGAAFGPAGTTGSAR